MVGKISPPFLWWGSIPFLGTPKTPLLWCRGCRGSCYVRARFNNLQQAVFSLFAHSSKIDRQANPNQGHPTDGQSLEDRKKNAPILCGFRDGDHTHIDSSFRLFGFSGGSMETPRNFLNRGKLFVPELVPE